MSAPFILSQTDSRPMYLQIMENIKELVIQSKWEPNHKLPSIREMAVALQVSVITVKRAYQELEVQGLIYTRPGKGSFVTAQTEVASKAKSEELNESLLKSISIARLLNMSDRDLINQLDELLKQEPSDQNGK